jgi:hypothetical protein
MLESSVVCWYDQLDVLTGGLRELLAEHGPELSGVTLVPL